MTEITKVIAAIQFRDISATTKDKALVELCDMVVDDASVIDPRGFLNAILEREKVMSTGIGMGVAIPHAKTSSIKDFVIAFGRCKKGIDFESLDGLPVTIIILIGAPENKRKEFLNLIAHIGKLFNESDFKQRFLDTESPAQIVKLFMQKFD